MMQHDDKPTRLSGDGGFALIVAIGVMFVSSLLVVAAFTAAEGDITLSHRDSTGKRAYYAALAGVQDYEYQLEENPDYWENCESPTGSVTESSSGNETPTETYKVIPLEKQEATGAAKEANVTQCKANPFSIMIQKSGAAANTFRVESIGTAGESKRSIVATFKVKGFLNYVYFTRFEDEDPGLYKAPKGCEGRYYSERKNEKCETIVFVSEDKINGPMHTDDQPAICGKPSFGRSGHSPEDVIEFGGEPYEDGCSEAAKPVYYNKKGWTKATPLIPPESDKSLAKYVKEEPAADELTGVTHIVMNGTANTLEVTTESGTKETLPWPSNGLIYVRTGGSCPTFEPQSSDTSTEETVSTKDECGNVYVSGTYSQSLTIGAENDVIINGSIYPTSVAGKLGAEPTGTDTLGLIASNYVRVYHPIEGSGCSTNYNYQTKEYEEVCQSYKNGKGELSSPWIYAAILSTDHSFVVDNYAKGSSLGDLNIYGAVAQDYRGIVGTTGGTGYLKNYVYDERLAVDEPPYFLSPLNSGWKVVRETTPEAK